MKRVRLATKDMTCLLTEAELKFELERERIKAQAQLMDGPSGKISMSLISRNFLSIVDTKPMRRKTKKGRLS